MVLADTNVIIDYWKMPDDRMTEIFNNEDIAVDFNVELLTRDTHFKLIQSVFPELKLYPIE